MNDTAAPMVSVILPAYNVAPYIGDALRSLQQQTYTDFEAIVVNDGSTDDIETALAPFRRNIVYITRENGGVSAARNTGLQVARGRYIAFLDPDDVAMPNYLEHMVGKLEADPTLDVIYPNASVFGEGPKVGRCFQDIYPPSRPVTYEKILNLECRVFIAVVFRRHILERVGGFDENLRASEDFDLWLRMTRNGARFDYTNVPLVGYRSRAGSLTKSTVRLASYALQVYEKVLAEPSTTPAQRAIVERRRTELTAAVNLGLAKQKIAERDFASACRYLDLANAYYCKLKLTLARWGLRLAPRLVASLVRA